MTTGETPTRTAEGLDEPWQAATPAASPPIRVQLLGQFRITIGDHVVDTATWRLRKAKSLVKLLALAPEHVLHRDELMDLLWPDLDPAAAANNLRYALYVARRAILPAATGSPLVLQMHGERIVLYPTGTVWIDVDAFAAAATLARRTTDLTAYTSALDLYTGDLLPEDRYEDWSSGQRETLRTTCLALLVDLAQLYEVRREYSQTIQTLERLLAMESIHEQAYAGLMRLYALTGRRSQALRQYQQLQETLRRELDAEPDRVSQQLYLDILAGRFPPPEALAAGSSALPAGVRRDNLPVPMTSLVGRSREIADIQRLLTEAAGSGSPARLLTLTGAGG